METPVLVLAALAIVGMCVVVFAFGHVITRLLAQTQEGDRQARCHADEMANKFMALADARAHAVYRQAAGPLGKPPAVRNHDTANLPLQVTPIHNGAAAANPADVQLAMQKMMELEAQRDRLGNVTGPGGYGEAENLDDK